MDAPRSSLFSPANGRCLLYRSDVEGLRAVAILLVVAEHANDSSPTLVGPG